LNPIKDQSVTVGQTLQFTVSATDATGNTPTFSALSLPAGATLSATGQFTWPNAKPAGNYTLVYYASDNNYQSDQGTINIQVTAQNSGGGSGGGSFDI
jgi:hypothetical protein